MSSKFSNIGNLYSPEPTEKKEGVKTSSSGSNNVELTKKVSIDSIILGLAIIFVLVSKISFDVESIFPKLIVESRKSNMNIDVLTTEIIKNKQV